MKIGIDLDGVVVDIMSPFIEYHNGKYKSEFTYESVTDHSFWIPWKLSREEGNRRLLEFMDECEFSVVKPQDGAIEAIRKLAEEHELVVVTSRPETYSKKTLDWIEHHLPGVFKKVNFTYQTPFVEGVVRKSLICKSEGVDVLIEDYPTNVLGCAGVCKKVLMFNQPWNQSVKELPGNVERVKNWSDVLERVNEIKV